MKKTYKTPSTRVLSLSAEHLMAASQVGVYSTNADKNGTVLAKRHGTFNDWDNEEEY